MRLGIVAAILGLAAGLSAQAASPQWLQVDMPARANHALAYDAARERLVLFGGMRFVTTFYLADTWEWDGSTWTARQPMTAPPARANHALAHDAFKGKTVLFGGVDATGASLSDTWLWDGQNWVLAQLTSAPPARHAHAMTFDFLRGRTVLFGGANFAVSKGFADTWEWDGTTWTPQQPVTSPPGRSLHAMVHDLNRQRVLLCGGMGAAGQALDDMWEWDGSNWMQLAARLPGGRSNHSLAYDIARQRVVLTGGLGTGVAFYSDTWEWDGTTWKSQGSAPVAQVSHAMAYDWARQRTILFGGNVWGVSSFSQPAADTWIYGVPAALQTFGSGCAGSNGVPMLGGSVPRLGGPLALDVISGRVNAPCLVGLAAGTQSLAVGGGCTLYVTDPIVPFLAVTNAAGCASVRLAVPLDTALRGGTAYAQAFVADPLGSAFGLSFSAGLALVIGD